MTEKIRKTSEKVSSPDTEILVECPDFGPESIESYYESSLATIGLFEKIKEYKKGIDGIVIACYGDPGLYPLKELFDIPVVGVAEASISISLLLGHKFSILVALKKAIPMFENLVNKYGLSRRLASIEATELSVLDFEENEIKAVKKLTNAGEKAKKNGAEVLILGCSGMTGLKNKIKDRTGLTVIDPVESAVKTIENLIELDLSQSNLGLYKNPPKMNIKGEMKGFFKNLTE